MFQTPILLITFNRPKHTEAVLTEIRKQKPNKLYIFQDGPRKDFPEDSYKCNTVRNLLFREIDWECNLKTLFQNDNLGCGYGPVKAISWLFEHEEMGIILEDDCVPSGDFFRFSKEMLEIYRNDQRIWMISGMNRLGRWKPNSHSYIFTRHGNTWGWASYRRAWNYFDHNMTSWFAGDGKEKIKKVVGDTNYLVFENDFNSHCNINRQKDVWDYQWHYARLYYSGLAVVPSVNLVANIGFDLEGTHTIYTNSSISRLKPLKISFPLKNHNVKIDNIFEWINFQKYGNPDIPNFIKKLIIKVVRIIFFYI